MKKNIFNILLLSIAAIVGYAVVSRYAEETRDFR